MARRGQRARTDLDGYLLIDKPAGLSSFTVVADVRRRLESDGVRPKAGHGGTLDPFATGVLVILLGAGTRLMPWVVGHTKEYELTVQFGGRSDTDDRTGAIERVNANPIILPAALAAVAEVAHRTTQRPPSVSAIHTDGERAYKRVRRGETVELPERPVIVHEWELQGFDEERQRLDLRARVSAGTYLRSLARDVGDLLGVGGYAAELRRTAVGDWGIEQAIPLDAVADDYVRPLGDLVAHLPRIDLDADRARRFAHGQTIETDAAATGPQLAVFGPARSLIGIATPTSAVGESATIRATTVFVRNPENIE